MNFYDVLAAKNWSGGIPTTNFFDLLFAQSISGEQWQVYEGTLPATISANGDDMKLYQIFGATGGVGDRTVSIFNFSENAQGDGYISNSILRDDGISAAAAFFVSAYLPIGQEQSYVYYTNVFRSTRGVIEFYKYDNGNYEFISRVSQQAVPPPVLSEYDPTKAAVVTAPSEATHMRINVDKWASQFYIVEGTTSPEKYVPYGYEVDISTSDGTSATVTPIYIGSDPLGKDEYVDYETQKVYRIINGALTPTDPPVSLPALPTCEGTTIISFAGQSVAPEKVYFEYQGGKQP